MNTFFKKILPFSQIAFILALSACASTDTKIAATDTSSDTATNVVDGPLVLKTGSKIPRKSSAEMVSGTTDSASIRAVMNTAQPLKGE